MMITLLKHVTFAAANNGQFITEWVRVPEGYQNWQLVFEVHTGMTSNPGSSVSLASLGPNVQDITTGMGPMVRVVIASTADSIATLSVHLTPKTG